MSDVQGRFEALIGVLAKDLYRYAYWLCHDREQAEDLVQETYLRAWKAREALRDERAARSWLYTIVQREHARLYERARPKPSDPDELQLLAPTEYDTSTEAFALRRAIGALPVEYRSPLLLQVLGGFSCQEIGNMLDLAPHTVMARVSRARRKLREKLTGEKAGQKTKGTRP